MGPSHGQKYSKGQQIFRFYKIMLNLDQCPEECESRCGLPGYGGAKFTFEYAYMQHETHTIRLNLDHLEQVKGVQI